MKKTPRPAHESDAEVIGARGLSAIRFMASTFTCKSMKTTLVPHDPRAGANTARTSNGHPELAGSLSLFEHATACGKPRNRDKHEGPNDNRNDLLHA